MTVTAVVSGASLSRHLAVTVQAVFSRPASEVVARLLGAENVGEGIAVADNQIATEGGAILNRRRPPLRPGRRVGWSVRPERVRLCGGGRYEARIESIAAIGVARDVLVRFGGTPLWVLADPSWRTPTNFPAWKLIQARSRCGN